MFFSQSVIIYILGTNFAPWIGHETMTNVLWSLCAFGLCPIMDNMSTIFETLRIIQVRRMMARD